uniref:Casein kinase II subunit beta n=1 Tax=Tetraselmis sp. GSL018 TaxID=582737 RepID=A0A061RZ77_9CHLO|mmetsp:Transcript_23776/g.56675  ORF Transcript_23776/g.56675 Transcript_23776/m.56675 type:complete len:278 (+) Transcript_23776:514-1347(+)|eukprot:CAMPEP_0177612532 /NCGR_PEP_ID=MMETSP0419_2-20121207/21286_1 /TAXON_ID=582737 /ORGANISM="Tetraselmis sp., Strain GSL018" /LENGTH=277 /DNA_ID=CAMNT_0019108757 /DNA_START=493 /DNA_END=1326 /DNA_ORIENTATION=-
MSRENKLDKLYGSGEQSKYPDDLLISDEDCDDSDGSGTDEDTSWISWFCSLKGNEFFCEVDEDYVQDDFNLSGLSVQVPYYEYALDLILDVDSPTEDVLSEEQHEMIESAAELLYGLIHVRYILTTRGLSAMFEKYKNVDFGRCPRVHCNGQPCLPVGCSDIPRNSSVKIFCPKCEDIFLPRSKYHSNIDGAYFGTTFPHLLLMSYPILRPVKPVEQYVPRVFGFKLHHSARQALPHGQSSGKASRGETSQQQPREANKQELQGEDGNAPKDMNMAP